ncbi:hypothetical protein CFI11_04380 [Thalassococcus sp. S3]|nr:hypothetical protein CFI11_04380 [Thalassococcus sp. S3]
MTQTITPSAEHILDLSDDTQVHVLMTSLMKERGLSPVVKQLNQTVLTGAASDREKAIAALRRMGFWFE